jgi:Domain of unknown function (DUF6265)
MHYGSLLFLVFFSTTLFAASRHTEHTFQLEEGEARPTATLEDASWLVGNWQGTAFGKQFEEIWSPPSQGSMVGMFKLFDADGVEFYELMLLTVDEGSLSLKVKHFTADFIAWEEKPDFVNFRLVKKEPGALHFSGLSFYQRGPDQIDGYIVMRSGDEATEHELRYQRVK